MTDPEVFAEPVFGLMAQQAVEKALKAWLCLLGRTYPLTHDLNRLAALLKRAGADVAAFSDLWALTPFASQIRYDAAPGTSLPGSRGDLIQRIEALFARVSALADESA